jgi:two-component system, chemotaxis family, chemotaxis protein CheY
MSSTSEPVLIVDDDADLREALRDTLEAEGYAVAEARDGGEALGYLATHPKTPLVLLDWNMAPMNGEQFMEERAKAPALQLVPVVLLTADARVAPERLAGLAGHLKKPVDLDALFALVAKHCR